MSLTDSGVEARHPSVRETGSRRSSTTASYFAEAPAETALSQAYAFGPAEVDPGTGWVAVDGTADTNVVVAESTEL